MAQQEDNLINTTQAPASRWDQKKKIPGTSVSVVLDPVVRISSSKVRSIAMERR